MEMPSTWLSLLSRKTTQTTLPMLDGLPQFEVEAGTDWQLNRFHCRNLYIYRYLFMAFIVIAIV